MGIWLPHYNGAEPDGTQMTDYFILGRDLEPLLLIPYWCHDWKSVEQRHRGLLNMVLCDGHLEEGKIKTLYFSEDESYARVGTLIMRNRIRIGSSGVRVSRCRQLRSKSNHDLNLDQPAFPRMRRV